MNSTEIQEYFIKMAPDFSTFDLVETWYYKKNGVIPSPQNEFVNYAYYGDNGTATPHTSKFFRAMFLVYTTGNISVSGGASDTPYITKDKSYVVFPYRDGTQIVIAVQNTAIKITSSSNIFRVVEVAF